MTGASVASTTTCTTAAGASLSGSSFEGGDGNLAVDATGCTDWANVSGRNIKQDKASGSNDNSFGQGSKSNLSNVSIVNGSIPPQKSDLLDFYEASEFVGTNNHNYLYLGWDRSNNLGSANMNFEINQSTTSGFTDTTTGPVTLNRTAGDLLVTYDFGGSGTPGIGLDLWTTGPTATGKTASDDCLIWDGQQGKLTSSGNSYPCWGQGQNLTGLGEAVAGINSAGSVANPLDTSTLSGDPLAQNTFGETAIDLTAANVFPSGTCKAFGSAYLVSRSSASFSAELKDFIAPQPVNISNCGTIVVNKVAQNGDNTFTYTGATTTGATLPTGFASFSLTTPGTTATKTFTNVPAGGYTVTEGAEPTNWTFVSLVCSATGTGTTAAQDGTTLTKGNITMAPGGVATCTYTNKTKLSPGITTSINGDATSSAVVGSTVHDTATLTGSFTSNAGGTVTYTVYKNNTCTTAAVAGTDIDAQPTAVTVTNGVIPNSGNVQFLTAGSYWFQAVYSGDSNNNGATSTCTSEPITITRAPTSAVTAQSFVPNDSFTLSGATSGAGGSITFGLYAPGDTTCTGTPVITQTVTVSGNGTYSTTNTSAVTTAGTYRWKDVYTGDTNNSGVTSACGTEQFTFSNS